MPQANINIILNWRMLAWAKKDGLLWQGRRNLPVALFHWHVWHMCVHYCGGTRIKEKTPAVSYLISVHHICSMQMITMELHCAFMYWEKTVYSKLTSNTQKSKCSCLYMQVQNVRKCLAKACTIKFVTLDQYNKKSFGLLLLSGWFSGIHT